MKLGTLRNGSRDGRLVVVSRDVTRCSDAHHIAPTLRHALDDWDRVAPHLDLIARGVESGGQPTERFHEREAHSPLPRAYQWAEAAGGAIRQAASDSFLDPRAPIRLAGTGAQVALGAGVAVIIGDVPMGAGLETARAAIRLVLLTSAARPRDLDPGRPAPATAFSPVAVTPDELGAAWDGGRLSGVVAIDLNGASAARLDSGGPMTADFCALIAEAARTRPLAAGSILGAGPVAGAGPALGFGDVIRVEMRDAAGHSIFGAIEQGVARFEAVA